MRWGNLAPFFHRDGGYADGLLYLGHLNRDAAGLLAGLDDGATATIELVD